LLRYHHGAYGFDPFFVGKAYYGDLEDGFVVEEGLLDLAPRDLDAAGVYGVLEVVPDV
jgi:hypothetical protein